MTDDPTPPDAFDDHPAVGEAFDHLRADAERLETMAPLQRVRGSGGWMSRRWLAGGAIAAVLLAIVGFIALRGDDGETVAAGGASLEAQLGLPEGWLTDTRWILEEAQLEDAAVAFATEPDSEDAVPGEETPLVGAQILEFDGDTIRLTGYCGGFTATVRSSGEQVRIDDVAPRGDACGEESLNDDVRSLVVALRNVDTVQIDVLNARVTLSGPDGTFRFIAEDERSRPETVDAPPLEGTSWELISVSGFTGPISIPESTPVELRFGGGRAEVRIGCSVFKSQPVIGDSSLAMNRWGRDLNPLCSPPADPTFTGEMLIALAQVAFFELGDGQLTLTGAGAVELRLTAAAPTIDPINVGRLDETSWLLVDSADAQTSQPFIQLVDDWPITLSFDGEQFGGTAACNGYGGRLDLDGFPIITELGSEEKACGDPAVMEAQGAYLEFLSTVEGGRFEDGMLLLSSELGEVFFAPDAPFPLENVRERQWQLTGWTDASGEVVPSNGPGFLIIAADGLVVGHTGCRDLTGEWVVAGASVLFTSFAADGDCAPELADQDNVVVTVLGDGFTANTDGTRLQLTSAGGEMLTYVLTDELPIEPLPAPADTLDGTEWRLVDAGGLEIIDPELITMAFDGNSVRGQRYCSFWGASFTLDGDSVSFVLNPLEAIGCGDDEDASTTLFLDAIERADILAFDLDGTLLINVGLDELIFERIDGGEPWPAPVNALDGTTWQILDSGAFRVSPDETIAFFDGDQYLATDASCGDTLQGTYAATGRNSFSLASGLLSEVGCERPAAEGFEWLPEIRGASVILSDGRLIIDAGLDELIFERIDGGEGPQPEPTPDSSEWLSVDDLLNQQPTGAVTVNSGFITYGDTTILCGAEDVNPREPNRCPGRWVVVTNYIPQVDGNGPHTGVLRDDGRFQIVGPGSGVSERGSGVDLTEDDQRVLQPLLDLSEGLMSGGSAALELDLAPTVDLHFGLQLTIVDQPAAETADANNWFASIDGFEGFSGSFSALESLEGRPVEVIVGPHDHCAGQPLELPESLLGLRQLSLQPTDATSCIEWFAVDVFVNDAGQIEAVMLALFGP